jgi:hypothetical protein
VETCRGDHGYGDLLRRLWAGGQDFVLVEDDVAPPPGAVGALLACPEPWCGHDYPLGRGITRGEHPGLGLVKWTGEATAASPELWRSWGGVPWRQLDGAVARAMRSQFAMEWYHRHLPDAAHAQHLR